jgi:hypothetical protein
MEPNVGHEAIRAPKPAIGSIEFKLNGLTWLRPLKPHPLDLATKRYGNGDDRQRIALYGRFETNAHPLPIFRRDR